MVCSHVWVVSIRGTSLRMAISERHAWISICQTLRISSFTWPTTLYRRSMISMASSKTAINSVTQIFKSTLTRRNSTLTRMWISNITSCHRSKSSSVNLLQVWSTKSILSSWAPLLRCLALISWWTMTSNYTSLKWTQTHASPHHAHCSHVSFHQSLTKRSEWQSTLFSISDHRWKRTLIWTNWGGNWYLHMIQIKYIIHYLYI